MSERWSKAVLIRTMPWWQSIRHQVETQARGPTDSLGTSPHYTVHNGVAGTARHLSPGAACAPATSTTTNDQNQRLAQHRLHATTAAR